LAFARSVLSAASFCDHCQKETHFLTLHSALALAGVSRSTMYYWMERRWIHWRESPSGRRLICEASLSRPMRDEPEILLLEPVRQTQKQSETVRKCPKPSNPVS
jgi:predicted DNA-binding transcriptional regulator AlpA